MKLTLKQHRFCLAFVETGNASAAYRSAYDAENMKSESIHVEACRLLKNPKITLTVDTLQARHRANHEVTVASLTAQLEGVLEVAMVQKNVAAAVSALTFKAKLHGLLSNRLSVKSDDKSFDKLWLALGAGELDEQIEEL